MNIELSGQLSLAIAAIQFIATVLPLGLANLITQAYRKSETYGSMFLTVAIYLAIFSSCLCAGYIALSKIFIFGPLGKTELSIQYFIAIIFASFTEVLCSCTYSACTVKRSHVALAVLNISRLLGFFFCLYLLIHVKTNSAFLLITTLYTLPFLASAVSLDKYISKNISWQLIAFIIMQKSFTGISLMVHPFAVTGASLLVRAQFKDHFSFSILGGFSVLIYTVSLFSSLGSGVLGHLNSKYYQQQPNSYFLNVLSTYYPAIASFSALASLASLIIFGVYLKHSQLIELQTLTHFLTILLLFILLSAQVFSSYCYPVIGQNLVVNEKTNVIVIISICSVLISWSLFYLAITSSLYCLQLLSINLFSSSIPIVIYGLYIYCSRPRAIKIP